MADIRTQLSVALADRYAIERELGEGGAAVVFLARDLRLGRAVALKVFRGSELGVDTERFLREIRVTARLQHPHIQVLHDYGESAGLLYYAMPYVEGETLRHRLTRDGALPPAEAFRVVREVAEALAYAHAKGVVHRDIKPENILLSQGHSVVADFGIVKAISEAGRQLLTRTGYGIGTLPYMSPEQLAGADVDGRTDIYSLGCVLFEILTGHLPFARRTPREAVVARLVEPPPRPSAIKPGLPRFADEIVAKAMAREPAERFQDAAEFAVALGQDPGPRLRSLPGLLSLIGRRLMTVAFGGVGMVAPLLPLAV